MQDTALAESWHYPLSISAGTESLTVPWYLGPVTDRFNPAVVVGADRTLKSGRYLRFYHTAEPGFFQHHWWMSGVFLDAELGLGYAAPLGIKADLRLGAGYLHYFWRRKPLELTNGEYEPVTNSGKPSLLVPLSMIVGYQGSGQRPWAITPFVEWRWAVQGLFLDEIPVAPHLFFLVGARVEWWRLTSGGEN